MSQLLRIIEERGFAIVASPPRNDLDLARAAFAGGADAIKVHCNVHHKASGNHFGSWSEEATTIRAILAVAEGPVGLMPGAETTVTRVELEKATEAGVDFVDVYDFHMPPWMLDGPLAAMVAVGPDWTSEGVAALDDLGMDLLEASIVPGADYGAALTVRDLEAYAVLSRTTARPVLVPSQKRIRPEDIPLLRRAGVAGVLLGTISLGDEANSIREGLERFARAR